MIITLRYLLCHAIDDSPSVSPVIGLLMIQSIQLCNFLEDSWEYLPRYSCSLQLYPSFWEIKTHIRLVSVSLSTDSMIRVGGDYQAQIPEFKPGKLGERKT